MNYRSNIIETIGSTPLVRINKMNSAKAVVLAKVEALNPSGSIKDRAAWQMIHDAMDAGLITARTTLIEPTSGNTGIGLAMCAAVLGMKLIIVMPDSMSVERRKMIAGYGAELVLTPGSLGMKGSLDKADELHASIPDSWIPQQFANPSNPKAHYETTGPELWQDTDGTIAAFTAGIGTGGTLSGIAKYLKEKNREIRAVAVEPASSSLLTGGKAGPHKIQGIGANFIPDNLDRSLVDEVMDITDEEAMNTARRLMREEGIAAGISSGAAMAAALKLAQRPEYAGRIIVAILPDTAARYLSTPLYEEGESK
jgi:cysteine synthase A